MSNLARAFRMGTTLLALGCVFGVSACAVPHSESPPLTGSTSLQEQDRGSTSLVGRWGAPDAERPPSITFGADGQFSGTDGCNRISGSWRALAEESMFQVGSMGTTLALCLRMDFPELVTAQTARLTPDALVFLDGAGAEVASLTRLG